ncbi:DnaB-like helicase C-terminal domain-containing protein [Mycoplasmopsis gallinacea]|uniref:Replicative DNA helicase n=1 Tax=Mycoplasmopsis gallinacea TaxID=29556 RepID=A0A449A231_9BACT|nr:DnaB-like helicase C-terminal domain-containing protein [Mycoplasmopsis gallinacea]VEU58297.1 Replicative DNA helicase [Mycoplasmopsis gallinacea]
MKANSPKNVPINELDYDNLVTNPSSIYVDEKLERKVLNIMITNDDRQLLGIDYFNEDTFFNIKNRQLFSLIKSEHQKTKNKNVTFNYEDISHFVNREETINEYPELSQYYLNVVLSSGLANDNNFLTYADRLLDLQKMRKAEAFILAYSKKLHSEKDLLPEQLTTDFENFFIKNNTNSLNRNNFLTLEEASTEFIEKIIEIKNNTNIVEDSVLSGFRGIDNYVNGFKPGQLIILAARPGIGKTALALNIARNISLNSSLERKRNVIFISLEMPTSELVARISSTETMVDLKKIQNPKYMQEVELSTLQKAKVEYLDNMNIYIDDAATSKINDIVWKIKHLYKNLKGELDFIVIDYLQLISAPDASGNRQNEIATISRTLKTLALELKVPIMALSQLSRNVESRDDNRPQLHDLRESGAIEQDADIVIFLSRPKMKKDANKNNENDNSQNVIKTNLTVAKNRNGQPGIASLYYFGNYVKFQDPEPEN